MLWHLVLWHRSWVDPGGNEHRSPPGVQAPVLSSARGWTRGAMSTAHPLVFKHLSCPQLLHQGGDARLL